MTLGDGFLKAYLAVEGDVAQAIAEDIVMPADGPLDEAAAIAKQNCVGLQAGGLVAGDYFSGGPFFANLAGIDPEDAFAEAADLAHLVADENDGAAALGDVLHFAEAFFLKFDIADGENFVHEQGFRL